MAVPEQTPYKEYTANGSTTSFALGFICDSKNDLIVLVDGVEPPVATWSLVDGNAVFTTALASGKKIILQRNTAMSRTTSYQSNNNSFRPETINKDFDWIWLKLQELGIADMLLRIYVDRLHIEQKSYIDDQDQIIKNIISDLRNYVNQQDGSLSLDINNLRTYVNQQDTGLAQSISNLRNYTDQQDNNLKNQFDSQINQQGVSLRQLNDFYNYLMQRIAQISVEKGWDASFVTTASNQNQQQINDFGGAKWRSKPLGYNLGATVKLENGDIVKSTVASNAIDPNVDMTGWVASGNLIEFKSIDEMRAKKAIKGQNAYLISVHNGAGLGSGFFTATQKAGLVDNGGTVISTGTPGIFWVRKYKSSYNLSDFGALPDPAKAAQNTLALANALKWGGGINIDNDYTCARTGQYKLEKSFILGGKGKLTVTGAGSTWFTIADIDYAVLDGLKIEAPETGAIFKPDQADTAIGKFEIQGGEYNMRGRVWYGIFSDTIDPETTFYGVREFRVKGAKIIQPRPFITCESMQHDLFEIVDNEISDLSAVTFSSGTANSHVYANKMRDYMKRGHVDNNISINADGFWAAPTSGVYYSFVLYEGKHLQYSNNHVEGMKTTDVVALYDLYCNADSLVSFGNTWKNNLCINSGKANNELMKAKATYVSIYRDNTYILEEDFVVRHGGNVAGADWVTLFEKTSANDKSLMSIKNCTFDLYCLMGMTSSDKAKNYEITDNTFNVKNIAGGFLRAYTNSDYVTDYSDAYIDMSNNIFNIENVTSITKNGTVYDGFIFFAMVLNPTAAKGVYNNIKLKDNTFNIKNVIQSFFFANTIEAKQTDTSGNTFNVENVTNSDRFRPFEYLTDQSTQLYVGENNRINMLDGAVLLAQGLNSQFQSAKQSKINYVVSGLTRNWSPRFKAPSSDMIISVTLDAISYKGVYSGSYNIKATATGIVYTDLDGATQTANYPESGSTTINPKIASLNSTHTQADGMQIFLYPLGTAAGEIGISCSYTDAPASTRKTKTNLTIETMVQT